MISSQDQDELQQLEESLWIAQTRFDNAYMEQILSPEFVQFGRSGKVYGREETLSAAITTSAVRSLSNILLQTALRRTCF
jgi:uncharacterized protein DUF4440